MTPLSAGAAGFENQVMSYGQSLSVGVAAGPVISTSQRFNSRMFSGGVRAQDGADEPWAQHASLVPLVEAEGAAVAGGTRFETPLSGMTEMLKEQGASPRFLASAPGKGATAIAALAKPGVLYQRVVDDVMYGRWRLGQAHKMLAYIWLQGEAETSATGYAAAMETLRANIDADTKAITGQPDDVWCLSYQLDRALIGIQHLAASDTYSRIRVALPIYFLPRSDGVHFTPEGSKIAGAYFGLAYKAIVLDGDTTWQPLKCTSVSVAGAVADLTYNRSGLVFDTTTVSAQTNQGFRLVDSGGSALTISSVAIVGGNTIRIMAAAAIPSGASVRYGYSSPTNTTHSLDKGNLRDSQGDSLVFDGGGLDYPMHNWAVLQSVALP